MPSFATLFVNIFSFICCPFAFFITIFVARVLPILNFTILGQQVGEIMSHADTQ
jgi:hypothetical protein